ncbi:tyrosine phosphatase family-domain-containing protein [Powellomyces hirtus]|nr:tyrosine phosphatase family-domain-containing protein [Powellomyces hirtus]
MTVPLPLYPPFRYGMVEEDLYRGAYPKERNFRFLSRLGLRTILSLTPEPANAELSAFCASNKITPIHVRVDKPKDHIPLSFHKTAQILTILIDPAHHPLFVHCLDGAGVTAAVIMSLRKLQCWTMAPILAESTRYHKEGIIGSEEAEFVEKFNAEVEIPGRLPKWLWGGTMSFKKHPSLRIKVPLHLSNPIKLGGSPAVGQEPLTGSSIATPVDISSLLGAPELPHTSSPLVTVLTGHSTDESLSNGDSVLARRSLDASIVMQARSPQINPSTTGTKDLGTPTANNNSKNDLRREKEDLRRRAVTENLMGVEIAGRSGDDPNLQARAESIGLDEDVEDNMSMTLQALALEMSSTFSKNPK